MLPEALRHRIEEQLGQPISPLQPAAGGSINQTVLLMTEHGDHYFLKWNSSADPDMFEKESKGLHILREAGTSLVVPGSVDCGTVGDTTGYLLLEYVEKGGGGSLSSEQFGRDLAALHGVKERRFGLDHNNYIGRLPQSNAWHESWIEFFIEERIDPQLRSALDSGRISHRITSSFDRLYDRLPDLFPAEPPSLLHGDLWGGNYFFNTNGHTVIYDPAVYYGNREIELAFTHLFGGFSSDFYQSYEEMWPLEPGFDSRTDIYNLYPLLVHANLFGGHYGRQVESIVNRFD